MGGLGFRATGRGVVSPVVILLVVGVAAVMIAALFPGASAAQPPGQQKDRCTNLDGKFDVKEGWEDGIVAPGIEIVSASGQEVVFEVGLGHVLVDLCVKTGNRVNYHVDTELPATGWIRITVSRAGTGPAIAHLSFDTEEVRFEDVCWEDASAGTTTEGSSPSENRTLDPLAALGSVAGPAASEYQDLGSAPIMSDNVTYHGTIPLDSPGVGGEVVVREDLGGRKFFYVTGLKGLSIYDVTNPAIPVLAGHLPFPHSQNEDLKVSDDGKTAVIAADRALAVPVNPVTTGITLIDTTDPALPQIVASSNDRVMGRGTAAGIAEHTAECANGDCSVIYGRTGRIYTVDRELGRVDPIGFWNTGRGANTGSGTIHALNRDETGLVISDSNPRLVIDPGVIDETATPENPRVLAAGSRAAQDNRLQHNNVRTDAAGWVPRAEGQDPIAVVAGEDFQVDPRSISVRNQRTFLCPGELVIGNSESNINPFCSAAGGLSTWSIQNFDQPGITPIQQLEVFRPLNGTWADGSPAVNALGCSGHWFTENDGIVTASWYEHGVRFFDIDKRFGTIKEIGYFQPVATEAGAAYWVDDSFVYAVDYARGIDILSFDREAPRPSQQELDQSWLSNLDRTGTGAAASRERYFCDLAARS
jgi:hypothetical protein